MDVAVTFLMTDIEGSTRRWELEPARMRDALAHHDEIIRSRVAQHDGQLLKERGEGDSHFVVFDAPSAATQCAISIQAALSNLQPLRVRMALHTGEADYRDGDYYGPAVNRCARIRSAGHGGQILVSQATHRLIRADLPPEAELLDLGRHRLKDLLTPERIYQLNGPGLRTDFPPLKTLDVIRHNLPVQLSSFVGRQKEMAEIRKLLDAKRLVTLAGPGGNGKTRLALQVGAEYVDRFPDGVWFIDLVPLRDSEYVAGHLLAQLKLSSAEEPEEVLTRHFEDQRALLILDNCEQILEGASAIARDLLEACPEVCILATSREPLGIWGEHVYRTPSMAHDLGSETPTVAVLQELDASALLSERVRDRGLPELLTAHQATTIAKLCQRLDGIPLALEQAAANLDVLSPDQLLAKLEQHFAMRAIEDAGVEERHRTLEATIDWSYELLSLKERLLLQRLSYFVGGWSLEAAKAICAGEEIIEKEVDGLLATLIRKSLVAIEQTSWEDRRFRLLEIIRTYASDRATVEPDLERRHFQYFSGLAQESLERLTGPDQARWLQLLEAEHGNLRLALTWAQTYHCSAEMAVAMRRFWLRSGFVREGLGALRHAVENESGLEKETEGHAFNAMGACAYKLGRLPEAIRYYEHSASIWNDLGRGDLQAAILHNMALVAIQTGDPVTAEGYLARSLLLHEQHGAIPGHANTLMSLGTLVLAQDRPKEASATLDEAAREFRRVGDRASLALALSTRADALWQAGDSEKGIRSMLEALGIWRDAHDPSALCGALLAVAEQCVERDILLAMLLFQAAERMRIEIGVLFDDYAVARIDRLSKAFQTVDPSESARISADAAHASIDKLIRVSETFLRSLTSSDTMHS